MYVNELSNFLEPNFRSFQNDINSLVEASHKIVNHLRKSYKINQEKQKSVSKFNSDKKDAKVRTIFKRIIFQKWRVSRTMLNIDTLQTLFVCLLFWTYTCFFFICVLVTEFQKFLKKWPCQLSKFLNFFDFSLGKFTDKQEQLHHCLLVRGWGEYLTQVKHVQFGMRFCAKFLRPKILQFKCIWLSHR